MKDQEYINQLETRIKSFEEREQRKVTTAVYAAEHGMYTAAISCISEAMNYGAIAEELKYQMEVILCADGQQQR